MVTVGEGGEQRLGTNINFFLEEYGISVNHDSVIRATYKTFAHPKVCFPFPTTVLGSGTCMQEAIISNGVLNREINRAAGKKVSTAAAATKNSMQSGELSSTERSVDHLAGSVYLAAPSSCLSFVYPYGATLNVQKPAIPILSTGDLCFPLHRPVAAFYKHPVCARPQAAPASSLLHSCFITRLPVPSLCADLWRPPRRGWVNSADG